MEEEILNIVDFSSEGIVVDCVAEYDSDVIENGMLGSFGRDGRYVFSSSVSQELIEMPKTIFSTEFVEETSTKVVLSYCVLPIAGRMDFKLTISKQEAVLYLVESFVNNLTGKAMLIDRFVDAIPLGEYQNFDEEEIFENYRIYEEEDDEAKALVFDMEDIIFRKMYLSVLSAQGDALDAFDYEEETRRILELLKNSGALGMQILTTFAQEMEENKDIYSISSSKLYHKNVNSILHQAITKVCTEETLDRADNRQIFAKIKNIQRDCHEKQLQNVKNNIDVSKLFRLARNAETHYIFENKEKLKQDAENFKTEFLHPSQNKKNQQNNDSSANKSDAEEQKKHHTLTQPILKQNKVVEIQTENPSKEEKIRQIVDKAKTTTSKVSPAKGKTSAKKMSVKKKTAKKATKKSAKKVAKAKSKSAKKVNKPSKAVNKKLSSKKKDSKKKDEKKDNKKKDEKKEEKKEEESAIQKYLRLKRRENLLKTPVQSRTEDMLSGMKKVNSAPVRPVSTIVDNPSDTQHEAPKKKKINVEPEIKTKQNDFEEGETNFRKTNDFNKLEGIVKE